MIHTTLRDAVRTSQGRESTPSVAIRESPSVKTTEQGGERGSDAAKKISGRTRHLLIETNGLIRDVVVHPANSTDRQGATWVRSALQQALPRVKRIWAESGSAGTLEEWVKTPVNGTLDIVKRPFEGGRSVWGPPGGESPEIPRGCLTR
jgi:hypothetical protein